LKLTEQAHKFTLITQIDALSRECQRYIFTSVHSQHSEVRRINRTLEERGRVIGLAPGFCLTQDGIAVWRTAMRTGEYVHNVHLMDQSVITLETMLAKLRHVKSTHDKNHWYIWSFKVPGGCGHNACTRHNFLSVELILALSLLVFYTTATSRDTLLMSFNRQVEKRANMGGSGDIETSVNERALSSLVREVAWKLRTKLGGEVGSMTPDRTRIYTLWSRVRIGRATEIVISQHRRSRDRWLVFDLLPSGDTPASVGFISESGTIGILLRRDMSNYFISECDWMPSDPDCTIWLNSLQSFVVSWSQPGSRTVIANLAWLNTRRSNTAG
jgi:hypothetical protein